MAEPVVIRFQDADTREVKTLSLELPVYGDLVTGEAKAIDALLIKWHGEIKDQFVLAAQAAAIVAEKHEIPISRAYFLLLNAGLGQQIPPDFQMPEDQRMEIIVAEQQAIKKLQQDLIELATARNKASILALLRSRTGLEFNDSFPDQLLAKSFSALSKWANQEESASLTSEEVTDELLGKQPANPPDESPQTGSESTGSLNSSGPVSTTSNLSGSSAAARSSKRSRKATGSSDESVTTGSGPSPDYAPF